MRQLGKSVVGANRLVRTNTRAAHLPVVVTAAARMQRPRVALIEFIAARMEEVAMSNHNDAFKDTFSFLMMSS